MGSGELQLPAHYQTVFVTAGIFTGTTVCTTVFRMVAKCLTKTPVFAEDYCALMAAAVFIVIEGMMGKSLYLGAKIKTVNDQYDQLNTEFILVYGSMYFSVMAFCMASIQFLYRRIFIRRSIRITANILLVCTLMWWAVTLVISIIYPDNLPHTFKGNPMQPQLHINYLNFWLSVGIVEQLILIVTVVLPLVAVKNLQISRQRKAFYILGFAVSYGCIGTGIARLAMVYRPHGGSFTLVEGDIFENVHLGTAIISANLPVCWPIITHRKEIASLVSSRFGRKTSEGSRSQGSAESESGDSSRRPSNAVSWPRAYDKITGDIEAARVSETGFSSRGSDIGYSTNDITVTRSYEVSEVSRHNSRDPVLPKAYLSGR